MTRQFARPLRAVLSVTVLMMAVLLLAACGGGAAEPAATPTGPAESTAEPTAGADEAGGSTPTAEPGPDPFADVPGIVDSTNRGWPRVVQGLNGRITIESKPARIHTTSVGFDEITVGLVPIARLAAVGTSTQNPDYSNVASVVADVRAVGRDPEQIASVEADLVVASPNRDADFIRALENVDITVVQLELREGAEGRIETILLLGYLYGEEERALQLVREVQERHETLVAATRSSASGSSPRVMYTTKYAENMTTSAAGSTPESITLAAGGSCAPCDAGLKGYPRISLETLISVNPDVIVIPMTATEGEAFRDELFAAPVLAEVPAIRDKRVYVVPGKFHTTLSYENIRGAEQLAAILWPGDFPAEYLESPPPFSLPAFGLR
ncbi:MAG: ABC transporter substrate-binding protein [Dehalococcoidia bacterium]